MLDFLASSCVLCGAWPLLRPWWMDAWVDAPLASLKRLLLWQPSSVPWFLSPLLLPHYRPSLTCLEKGKGSLKGIHQGTHRAAFSLGVSFWTIIIITAKNY